MGLRWHTPAGRNERLSDLVNRGTTATEQLSVPLSGEGQGRHSQALSSLREDYPNIHLPYHESKASQGDLHGRQG